MYEHTLAYDDRNKAVVAETNVQVLNTVKVIRFEASNFVVFLTRERIEGVDFENLAVNVPMPQAQGSSLNVEIS